MGTKAVEFKDLPLGWLFVLEGGEPNETYSKTEPKKYGPYLCNCLDWNGTPQWIEPLAKVYPIGSGDVVG